VKGRKTMPNRGMMMNTRDIGALAEERAADFLQDHGYVVVARNWR